MLLFYTWWGSIYLFDWNILNIISLFRFWILPLWTFGYFNSPYGNSLWRKTYIPIQLLKDTVEYPRQMVGQQMCIGQRRTAQQQQAGACASNYYCVEIMSTVRTAPQPALPAHILLLVVSRRHTVLSCPFITTSTSCKLHTGPTCTTSSGRVHTCSTVCVSPPFPQYGSGYACDTFSCYWRLLDERAKRAISFLLCDSEKMLF